MNAVRRRHIKSWVFGNGERYCALVDRETGLPLFLPALFVTVEVRNRGQSLSAMEAALTAINICMDFADETGIDLERRMLMREFLAPHECEALKDHCLRHLRDEATGSNVQPIAATKKGYKPPRKAVKSGTQRGRLTGIATYLEWMAKRLLAKSLDSEASKGIDAMKKAILSRRPKPKGRNKTEIPKGLNEEQEQLLWSIVAPGSAKNPFKDATTQSRNAITVKLLNHLGIRGGELLNLQVGDIDFANGFINIYRRADAPGDSRRNQPLVKTLARTLAIAPELADEIRDYVVKFRKPTPNSSSHGYLLVVHKSGPTLGQPLSKQGLQYVCRQIAATHPKLKAFKAHGLRHTWNDRFSEAMDKSQKPVSPKEQEQRREYQMGWNEGSGTAKVYNQRFVRRKAHETGRQMQAEAHQRALEAKSKAEADAKNANDA